MRDLQTWWDEENREGQTWLILGKGPSFDERDRYDLRPYKTIAINHVVRELPVDVTSAVNFEVVGDCAEAIYQNSRILLMPRYPHTIIGDGPLPLEDYFKRYPVLQKMSDENRLVWYNLSSDPTVPGMPVVKNGSFSVCILFNLLGLMGARHVRTLGIDGGQFYGASFSDMQNRTRLANGMETYDHQFNDMMQAVKDFRLDYRPLNRKDIRLRLFMKWILFRRRIRTNPRATINRWLRYLNRYKIN